MLDIRDFKLGKVAGDGNCTLRAILKGAGLDENKHSILREALTEVIRENKFEQHTLDANGFLSKQDLIDFVSTPGEHIGMEIVAFLLEKYNIRIDIWVTAIFELLQFCFGIGGGKTVVQASFV